MKNGKHKMPDGMMMSDKEMRSMMGTRSRKSKKKKR